MGGGGSEGEGGTREGKLTGGREAELMEEIAKDGDGLLMVVGSRRSGGKADVGDSQEKEDVEADRDDAQREGKEAAEGGDG